MNPLAETKDGKLIAADAKLGFDDNAAFRQKELMSLRDTSQEDPRCAIEQQILMLPCVISKHAASGGLIGMLTTPVSA